MKKIVSVTVAFLLVASLAACTAQSSGQPAVSNTPYVQSAAVSVAAETAELEFPQASNESIIYFTIILHLEGWEDGDSDDLFAEHAAQLREYANLFEQYGGVMTLEAKEIIDGCLNWGDNVLLEMQQRGHAVGIHADAGGGDGATVGSIKNTLLGMKGKLGELGIDTSFASGVASKADWVKACLEADIRAVTCMVNYGLWSLDEDLRPDWFTPYGSPAEGHDAYPPELTDRLHPWRTSDGSTWILDDPEGNLVIIPSGMSLNNAYEEGEGNTNSGKTDFTREDIEAWAQAMPLLMNAAEPGKINTFYAVWSFGKAVDMELMEKWLHLIDSYVQQGRVQWASIPDMVSLYNAG